MSFSKNKLSSIVLSIILFASILSISLESNDAHAVTIFNPQIPVVNPDPSGADFGWSISEVQSTSGDVGFAVGAPGNNVNAGVVYVFDAVDGNLLCTINPNQSPNHRFGEKVEGIGTSGKLAVGIPGANSGLGQVKIFNIDSCFTTGGAITTALQTISNPSASGKIGSSKLTAVNDNELLIGNPTATAQSKSQAGLLYRYNVNSPTTPIFTYNAGASADVNGLFGTSSAIIDSSQILVGAPGSNKAFVMNKNTGVIITTLTKGLPTDGFGSSVQVFPGKYVVSAPLADPKDQFGSPTPNAGIVYVFSITNPLAQPTEIIKDGGPQSDAQFGFWIESIDGRILIGSPFHDATGTDDGLSELVSAIAGSNFEATFDNPNTGTPALDQYGYSVAIVEYPDSTLNMVTGAPKTEPAGAVYYINPAPGPAASVGISINGQSGTAFVSNGGPFTIDYFLTNTGTTELFLISFDSIGVNCSPPFIQESIFPSETKQYQCVGVTLSSDVVEQVSVDMFDFGSGTDFLNCNVDGEDEMDCDNLDIIINQPDISVTNNGPISIPTGTTADVIFTVENTGNSPLSNVSVDTNIPIGGCSSTVPASIDVPPGGTQDFTCTTDPLTLPLTILGTASGTGPLGGFYTDITNVQINLGTFSMILSSDAVPNPVQTGFTSDVTFTVDNNGDFTLNNVSITTLVPAGQGCSTADIVPLSATIPAGDSQDFTCTTNPLTANLQIDPIAISLEGATDSNFLTVDVGDDSFMFSVDAVPNPVQTGFASDVTFTVDNTGSTTLNNVSITTLVPAGQGCSTADIVPLSATIPAGDSQDFTCTTDPLTGNLQIDPTMNAVGQFDPLTETQPLTVQVGGDGLTLSVDATENPFASGDTPTVTFTVDNTGSTTLNNVSITTLVPAGQGCSTADIVPLSATIPAGDSQDFTCTTDPLTANLQIDPTVTADGLFGQIIQTELFELQLAVPSISIITNFTPTTILPNPGSVMFDFAVTNDGNIPIINLDLSSTPECETGVAGPFGDDGNNQLDIGETWTYDECTISFTTPGTNTTPFTFSGIDTVGQPVSQTDSVDVVVEDPIIGLTVTYDPINPLIGESVTLDFEITNNGNIPVDAIFVDATGPFPEICEPEAPGTFVLNVGESTTLSCVVTFSTTGPQSITAIAEANSNPHGTVINDTQDVTIQVVEPITDVTITSIIRDFKQDHPDMEQGCTGGICTGVKTGLVKYALGLDGNPIFNEDIDSTNGPVNFNQWYNPVTGVNQCTDYDMVLIFDESTGKYTFTDGGITGGFFPIDNQLWQNEGKDHNYHFTMESKATFEYQSGLFFTINGADDDTFVFINDKRVIDLGGLHPASQATASIDLDDPMLVNDLGLVPGEQASFSLFFAERQSTGSNLLIETNIQFTGVDQGQCDAPANSAELRITKDGEIVELGPATLVFDTRITQGSDDAEQVKKEIELDSSDLDLNEKDHVGLRFQDVSIPKEATITNAYVKFTSEDAEGDTGKSVVRISAEDTDNASTFSNSKNDISKRKTTSSKVDWDIPNWNSGGLSGEAQTTPNIASMIQEVVNRNGWEEGNSIVLIFDAKNGKNDRDAKSFENDEDMSALLYIEFESDTVIESNLIYTVTVTNNGPEPATNVNIIDELPEEVTAISVEPVPECSIVDDQTINCNFTSLAVGESEEITIVTSVSTGTIGTITNTASVSSSKLDPYLGNNQVSLETTIGGAGQLFCGQPESFYDNVIRGTDRADKLKGTNGNDLIFGYGGPDKIHGYKGNDCIYGGSGNDKIYGHNGMDTIFGEEGNDRIYGNNDDDVLSGGEGRDYLRGGYGDDEISGGSDRDNIRGGQGDDSLSGDSGDDNIHGGSGDDFIDGGADTDLCKGGSGNNTVINCEQDDKKKDKDEDDDD